MVQSCFLAWQSRAVETQFTSGASSILSAQGSSPVSFSDACQPCLHQCFVLGPEVHSHSPSSIQLAKLFLGETKAIEVKGTFNAHEQVKVIKEF